MSLASERRQFTSLLQKAGYEVQSLSRGVIVQALQDYTPRLSAVVHYVSARGDGKVVRSIRYGIVDNFVERKMGEAKSKFDWAGDLDLMKVPCFYEEVTVPDPLQLSAILTALSRRRRNSD